MSSPALLDWLASCSNDPVKFVLEAFPWGENRLAGFEGPEDWQWNVLERIKSGLPIDQAIQLATASGHGVGKSCLVAWIILCSISPPRPCSLLIEITKGLGASIWSLGRSATPRPSLVSITVAEGSWSCSMRPRPFPISSGKPPKGP